MKISINLFIVFIVLCSFHHATAQDLQYAKRIIRDLCSEKMSGRGYVNNGVNVAADYLEDEFKRLKLKKFGDTYSQTYSFPVNTFPKNIQCIADQQVWKAGVDFLLDAGSPPLSGRFHLLKFLGNDSLDLVLMHKKIKQGFNANEALVIRKTNARSSHVLDSCKFYGHYPACFVYTEEKKLTYTVATHVSEYPSLTVWDSLIVDKEGINAFYENQFIPNFACKNLAGFIKGKNTDSMIVFSAHYDHLGKLGPDAMFPGASDNASGVSMICYLANYFSIHKPPCNIAFVLFSGEEAGLLGSAHFTEHPMFALNKIKLLINIDIMGDAEKGITVVNGEVFRAKFDQLVAINKASNYLPTVAIRGKAKNSDHYYFSEKGIPAFFIYSMGGPGFYHDIMDTATSIQLTNYEAVARCLIDFVNKL